MKLKDLLNLIEMNEGIELYIFDNAGFVFNDLWRGQPDILYIRGNRIVTNITAGDSPSIIIEIE